MNELHVNQYEQRLWTFAIVVTKSAKLEWVLWLFQYKMNETLLKRSDKFRIRIIQCERWKKILAWWQSLRIAAMFRIVKQNKPAWKLNNTRIRTKKQGDSGTRTAWFSFLFIRGFFSVVFICSFWLRAREKLKYLMCYLWLRFLRALKVLEKQNQLTQKINKYSSLPISRSLKGNEKNIEIAGVRHIGGSKKFLIFNVKINKD